MDANPMLAVKLRNADLLVDVGLDLEIGWLPPLVNQSRERATSSPAARAASPPRAPSRCSTCRPEPWTGAAGDLHPGGNPHFLSDPGRALQVAAAIAERLSALDRAERRRLWQRLQRSSGGSTAASARWQAALAPVKGRKIFTRHRTHPVLPRLERARLGGRARAQARRAAAARAPRRPRRRRAARGSEGDRRSRTTTTRRSAERRRAPRRCEDRRTSPATSAASRGSDGYEKYVDVLVKRHRGGAAMSAPLVRLEGAAIGYGGRPLLAGLDVAVAPGDFLAVVGPNGGGKTTLLRTLLGALPLVAGRRRAARGARGRLRAAARARGRDLAVHRGRGDADGSRACARAVGGGRGRAIATRSRRALARVGVEHLAQQRFGELSGGQRQRTLIARALAAEPELLALDEPTNGMDPGAELATMDLLRDLHRGGRLAIVMVSHRLEAVANYARTLAFVDKDAGALPRRGRSSECSGPTRSARSTAARWRSARWTGGASCTRRTSPAERGRRGTPRRREGP